MAENENSYFEGVEKLLEIWFIPQKNADLRKISRSTWDALLKSVRCEIISFSRNDNIDAYVLSESSMFVSKRRWILKTCGTTTPLQCLKPLLKLAEDIGYSDIEDLYYSRKNFKRPELQISPHGGFDEEVSFLDGIFNDGRAYCFGSVNRECWYLYTLNRGYLTANKKQLFKNIENITNNEKVAYKNSINSVIKNNGEIRQNGNIMVDGISKFVPEPDQTIEILMTELDPKIMSIFSKEKCSTAIEATEKSGIDKLIPGMIVDDFLFEPCGYSMNGIMKNGAYMTIHITPEAEYSYVSFESNIAAANYTELISRVVKTFQPGKFVVTIFANKTSPGCKAFTEINDAEKISESWQRLDIQYCRFKTCDLTYAHYSKFPS